MMAPTSDDDLIDFSAQTDVRSSGIEPHSLAHELQNLENALPKAVSKDAALQIALDAAELSMRALKLAKTPNLKKNWSSKVKSFLDEAEQIKYSDKWNPMASKSTSKKLEPKQLDSSQVRQLKEPSPTRALSNQEQKMLLLGSRVNGFKFPPWKEPPKDSDFELKDGTKLFLYVVCI